MDLWIYGFMDLWIYAFMDLWIYGFMHLWIYGFMDLWIDWLDVWIGEFMDGWMDGLNLESVKTSESLRLELQEKEAKRIGFILLQHQNHYARRIFESRVRECATL